MNLRIMASVLKPGSEAFGYTEVAEPCDARLSLKPAELEELIAQLCSCSTRRIRSNETKRTRTQCAAGVRAEWCRLGERSGVGSRYAETRFG